MNRKIYTKHRRIIKVAAVLLTLLFGGANFAHLYAQSKESPDSLFKQARDAAFDQKDYTKAIKLSQEALMLSPDYVDIKIFLGRLYAWKNNYEKATSILTEIIKTNQEYEDAFIALTDLEYWQNNYSDALNYCNTGLENHPESKELLLRKAKLLSSLNRNNEAREIISELQKKYPKNIAVKETLENIRFYSSKNEISVSHELTWFNKDYANYLHRFPWHLAKLGYKRYTGTGPLVIYANYGNRFNTDAFQFETELYPRIAEKFRAFINAGVSNNQVVFPDYKVGTSLYTTLPYKLELETGIRLLHYNNNTIFYVGGLSKYYKKFWFNGRVYLTPKNNEVSHSYLLDTRYYFGGADDFCKINIGYGLSPDETNVVQDIVSNDKIQSVRIALGIRKSIRKYNALEATFYINRQKFASNQSGNQLGSFISYIRKF